MESEPTQKPEPSEQASILERDGAIAILREIRADIRTFGATPSAAFTLAHPDQQMVFLRKAVEAMTGQLFAMSIMLSGILGDPTVAAELAVEDEGAPDVAP